MVVSVLSLHQLTCFLATYEHGSLTAAAEELGYAQPSISEQVRALEKSLGVQLFRRVGRGVVPTTIADTLRPHAEATLAAAEVLDDLRRGRIEAALIAAPPTNEGLEVVPVARDELVYVSADPARTAS